MPAHNFAHYRGRLEYLNIDSTVLWNNRLGDPSHRDVAVYLPEGYDQSDESYPLMVDLAGFTGSGFSHLGWKAFGENLPQRVDRLIAEEKMGPVILVMPDCFTSLGGNQYINSAVMGNWSDFLLQEMLPTVTGRFRVLPGAEHRAVFGKSSGGYGALMQGMLTAEHWGAVACHSGDMAFDLVYRADFPGTLMHLSRYGGSVERFMKRIGSTRAVTGNEMHTLMVLAMAASYDPDPDAPYGVRLPVTEDTCELIEERWKNWLSWDPLTKVQEPEVQERLKSLKGLFIDCGDQDQYNLLFGARRLHRELSVAGINHHYEEFDDNHSGIDYRMDVSLPYLYECIAGPLR
ncbi:MAG: hypothetical protein KDI36_13535 [Pseudomonadales bacterium]|nr:hypothetical protein [Pseudomonadales bacterium]